MDYEKLYKDALERAKIHINIKGIGDTMDLCKQLFPELCESEDERIRKEINTLYSEIDTCISELIKARTDKDSEAEGKALFKMEGLMVATLQDLSCIEDYLEKQKEPIPIPNKFSGLKSLMLQYLQSAANRKDDTEIESDTDLFGRKILDYVWKYDGKQKEQKEPHYTKRNALFDKCVENCDPEVMKEVSDKIDEMLQKEQNGEDEEDTDFTIYYPLKNGKGEYKCTPYSFYGSLTSFSEDKDLIDFLRTCFYTEEECNEWIKQQKEQKPELPLMGGDTDTYFDDLRITTKSLTSREWFNEGIKYAQRLQKEQHTSSRFLPNDWVVYDGPLGHAILQIGDVIDGRYTFVDNDSTLLVEDSDKFLRPLTPKDVEKKEEWSEEDEETIGTLINYFEGDALDYSADEMIRRIRALRPSWKPSKEKMTVLDKAIPVCPEWLYEELKRVLKED